jgi:hypothetical protein
MIILELDIELNTNVGAYKILHLLTKNENFSQRGQRVMNFSLTELRCPVSTEMMLWVFVLHILLVDDVNKLVNMWLMKTPWISDGGTNSCIPQWFWCKWEWRSATSSQHDHSGAIHGHPNWGDASALATAVAACSAAAEQSPCGESWWPALSHQVWAFLCHEATDFWGGQRATGSRCVDQGHWGQVLSFHLTLLRRAQGQLRCPPAPWYSADMVGEFQDHDPRRASNHMGWIQEGFQGTSHS